jgi:hypothetical protein
MPDAASRSHFMNVRGLEAIFDSYRRWAAMPVPEPTSRFLQWLEIRDRHETLRYVGANPDSIREVTDA